MSTSGWRRARCSLRACDKARRPAVEEGRTCSLHTGQNQVGVSRAVTQSTALPPVIDEDGTPVEGPTTCACRSGAVTESPGAAVGASRGRQPSPAEKDFPSLDKGILGGNHPPREVTVAEEAARGGSQASFAALVTEEATEGALDGSHFPKGWCPQVTEAEEVARDGSQASFAALVPEEETREGALGGSQLSEGRRDEPHGNGLPPPRGTTLAEPGSKSIQA